MGLGPEKVVLVSPWTDLGNSTLSQKNNYEKDVFCNKRSNYLQKSSYVPQELINNEEISPISYKKEFPPTLIIVGEDEVLLDDSTIFGANVGA